MCLESASTDDDWEKELFGDDLQAVQELAKKMSEGKVRAPAFSDGVFGSS